MICTNVLISSFKSQHFLKNAMLRHPAAFFGLQFTETLFSIPASPRALSDVGSAETVIIAKSYNFTLTLVRLLYEGQYLWMQSIRAVSFRDGPYYSVLIIVQSYITCATHVGVIFFADLLFHDPRESCQQSKYRPEYRPGHCHRIIREDDYQINH